MICMMDCVSIKINARFCITKNPSPVQFHCQWWSYKTKRWIVSENKHCLSQSSISTNKTDYWLNHKTVSAFYRLLILQPQHLLITTTFSYKICSTTHRSPAINDGQGSASKRLYAMTYQYVLRSWHRLFIYPHNKANVFFSRDKLLIFRRTIFDQLGLVLSLNPLKTLWAFYPLLMTNFYIEKWSFSSKNYNGKRS